MAKRGAPGPSDLSYIAPDLRALARSCAELTADPRNARKHGERNLAATRASLERFGQRKPIVVRAGVVVAGNATLHETVALGRSHVAVANADDLTADEARAYGVADNRTAELAEWDDVHLRSALEGLESLGLLASTGFDGDDLDRIASSAPVADLSAMAPADTAPVLGDNLEHHVVVDARDESHQRALIERFRAEGLKCRALIS